MDRREGLTYEFAAADVFQLWLRNHFAACTLSVLVASTKAWMAAFCCVVYAGGMVVLDQPAESGKKRMICVPVRTSANDE